jgi:3,4-dihydroxy 2-butanone 4-phosphate synthase/GTP cyclohydrolase II
MRLMTNNPAKYVGLEGYGLDIVERVPLEPASNPENVRYLRTKRERLGHLLTDPELAEPEDNETDVVAVDGGLDSKGADGVR